MDKSDIHIVGGGISGLYLAYLLSKQQKKIYVYEKMGFWGGRIQTEYDNNHNVLYEKGPWRIHPSHRRILRLVADLGLKKKEIKQTIHNAFSTTKNKKPSSTKNQVTEYQAWCIEEGIDTANDKMLESGYDMLLQRANGTRSYSYKTYEDTDRFFVLDSGFSSIVDGLLKRLRATKNVFLLDNHNVSDICYDAKARVYTLFIKRRRGDRFDSMTIRAGIVVMATPPHVIKTYSLTLSPNTSMVSSLPLMHVYARFKTEQPWNAASEKRIVSSPISQIISSTFDNAWFQISYCAGRFAMMLHNFIVAGSGLFEAYVTREFRKTFRASVTDIRPYFWRHAVHYWNPNLPASEKVMMNLNIEPHRKKYPNLYWIGEAISTKQGWMEGAIETSLRLYERLTSAVQVTQHRRPEEYVIYDGRVLDVKEWKHVHPGSKEAIENHMYEDITDLWDTYHPREASKYMILLEKL